MFEACLFDAAAEAGRWRSLAVVALTGAVCRFLNFMAPWTFEFVPSEYPGRTVKIFIFPFAVER
jgi:hypothetical protein